MNVLNENYYHLIYYICQYEFTKMRKIRLILLWVHVLSEYNKPLLQLQVFPNNTI